MGLFKKEDKAAKASQSQQQEKQKQKQKDTLPVLRYVHVPQHAEKDHFLAVPTAWKADRKERLKEAHANRMAKEAAHKMGSCKDKEARAGVEAITAPNSKDSSTFLGQSVSRTGREAIASTLGNLKTRTRTPSDEGMASPKPTHWCS